MSSASDYLNAFPANYRLQEFELLSVLGAGGFGITYMGMDHLLNKKVAIKEYLPNDFAVRRDHESVLPKSTADKDNFAWGLDRFLDEARVLAHFDHPNIIRVHRYFESNGTAYIVMDYAEGATLDERLKSKRTLKPEELNDILFPILDGLEVVHRANFLHRDLKPSNIIIRKDGTPVILDFGAARQAVSAKSRSVTAIVTPGYAPIEQYSTKGNQGPWTDIYALAAIAHCCIVGARPADATERVYDDPLVGWVDKRRGWAMPFLLAVDVALAFKEKDRPQSIAEWRKLLIQGQEATSDSSRPPTTKESSRGAKRLRRIALHGRQRFLEKPVQQILLDSCRKSKARIVQTLLAAKRRAEKPAFLWATMVMLTITSVMLAVVYFRPMLDSARIDSPEQSSLPNAEQSPRIPVDIKRPPLDRPLSGDQVEKRFKWIAGIASNEEKLRLQGELAGKIVDDLSQRISEKPPDQGEWDELDEIVSISKSYLSENTAIKKIGERVWAVIRFQRLLEERKDPERVGQSGHEKVLNDWTELLDKLAPAFESDPYGWQKKKWNDDVLEGLFASVETVLEQTYPGTDRSESGVRELMASVTELLEKAGNLWKDSIDSDKGARAKDLKQRSEAVPRLIASAGKINKGRFTEALDQYIGPLQEKFAGNGWVESKIADQKETIREGFVELIGEALDKKDVKQARRWWGSFQNDTLGPFYYGKDVESLNERIDQQQQLAELAKPASDTEGRVRDSDSIETARDAIDAAAGAAKATGGEDRPTGEDASLWFEVGTSCVEQELRRYLEEFPSGRYINEAWEQHARCEQARHGQRP